MKLESKSTVLRVAIGALLVVAGQAAMADSFDLNAVFDSGTLGSFTVSGQVTESSGLVTGMTGNLGGTFGSQFGPITGIIAGGPSTFSVRNSGGDDLIADNVWNSGTQNLDTNGIDFTTASGMVFNLWQSSPTSFTLFSGYESNDYRLGTVQGGYVGTSTVAGFYETATGSITPAVPEPKTYGMVLAGFGLLGFAVRHRKRKVS